MKLGPVTKHDKRNKTTKFKKNFDDVIKANCDILVVFLIYGQLGAIRKPVSGHSPQKFYFHQ